MGLLGKSKGQPVPDRGECRRISSYDFLAPLLGCCCYASRPARPCAYVWASIGFLYISSLCHFLFVMDTEVKMASSEAFAVTIGNEIQIPVTEQYHVHPHACSREQEAVSSKGFRACDALANRWIHH